MEPHRLRANAWENSGELAAIVGYSDLNPTSGTPKTKEMSGLKVTGKDTFTVTLDHADSQFPLQLSQAQTAFYPMPEAAYEDLKAYDAKPIGNGPYEMTEKWKANQPFTVTAWKGYEGTKAKTKDVTFKSYSDMNTAYTDVLAGNADVLFLPADKMTSAVPTSVTACTPSTHRHRLPRLPALGRPVREP